MRPVPWSGFRLDVVVEFGAGNGTPLYPPLERGEVFILLALPLFPRGSWWGSFLCKNATLNREPLSWSDRHDLIGLGIVKGGFETRPYDGALSVRSERGRREFMARMIGR